MTFGAWIYMLAVWTVIVAVNVFCFTRIFRKHEQTPHNPPKPRD